jgi:hypothetical protein
MDIDDFNDKGGMPKHLCRERGHCCVTDIRQHLQKEIH